MNPTSVEDMDLTNIVVTISEPESKTACKDPEYKRSEMSVQPSGKAQRYDDVAPLYVENFFSVFQKHNYRSSFHRL